MDDFTAANIAREEDARAAMAAGKTIVDMEKLRRDIEEQMALAKQVCVRSWSCSCETCVPPSSWSPSY